MADENRLWGAERIRGELLKLGFRVSKRTIQKYLKSSVRPHPTSQRWVTFIDNHAKDISGGIRSVLQQGTTPSSLGAKLPDAGVDVSKR